MTHTGDQCRWDTAPESAPCPHPRVPFSNFCRAHTEEWAKAQPAPRSEAPIPYPLRPRPTVTPSAMVKATAALAGATPRSQHGSPTSRQAAGKAVPRAGSQARQIHEWALAQPHRHFTRNEAHRALDLLIQSTCGAVDLLLHHGLAVRTNTTRRDPVTGQDVEVLQAVEYPGGVQ